MPRRSRNPNRPARHGRAARFAAEIDQWFQSEAAVEAGGGGHAFVVDTTFGMFASVVDRSPVKSGTFKGNWRLGVGERKRGWFRNRADKGGDRTTYHALLELQRMRTVPPFLWITNDVPYALKLERGYSKQAPYGVVALTVEAFSSRFGTPGYGLGQYIGTGRDRGRLTSRRAA